MKNIEIKKSELSELIKGTRGAGTKTLSEKFGLIGAGIMYMIKHKGEIIRIKFSKTGNVILDEELYLKLAKEAEMRKIDKLKMVNIVTNISQSVYQDFENVKIEIKTIQTNIENKLNAMEKLEKSIALNSKKMEEMMIKMDSFYTEQQKYIRKI